MAFTGSGDGEVTFQRDEEPSESVAYTLNVSENDTELYITFMPVVDAVGDPPVVTLEVNGYDPTQQVYDAAIAEAFPLIIAEFGVAGQGGQAYDSGGACTGHVHTSWVGTSSGRTYTGWFWAYSMVPLNGGSPISLKFVRFSFDVVGANT